MLKTITGEYFSQGEICFHEGLNIILGDDDARNSIGKSTVLMVIDFVMGGSTFLADEAGVIRELGHHHYNFSLEFNSEIFYFSRDTASPEVIQICDEKYIRIGEISLDEFKKFLKSGYGLEDLETSFRSVVNPFSRIWRKGGLDPNQPFVGAAKEANAIAIARIIDLFERSADIAAERAVLEVQKEKKSLINKSMGANIIPSINRKKREENIRLIEENGGKIQQLKEGFGGALSTYESLFDEELKRQQYRKNDLSALRTELQNKIRRLQREMSGITPRLAANIALLADFFPVINVERLEQVETFHQKIGAAVKKELREELENAQREDHEMGVEIAAIESHIQAKLSSKGMPDDLFKQVFDLKETTDRAAEENKHFDQKVDLEEAIRATNERLDRIYAKIFLDLENRINLKLKAFNAVVYGASRASSELRFKSASSYQFTSPADSGTGASYAGLIGFDLAMLSLTKTPYIIHDSVIYKNIQVTAVKRILRILAAAKSKQIFISFDEGKKYGQEFVAFLQRFTVLKLAHDKLLYKKDWRDRK
ncbi:DUF2326 domain-containing protein [Paracidovorax konjaci]|uniref:Uncharacterized protein YydD, contains DUF2326 domain n=1 Tax=Paracidovorax konjaci TaxID=32040 RepID=A0A1I1U4Y8_9BURK|nr:DUF2326 domain-containing protein [Paracidovorax konjaci]SFD62950.1 Uncharacterized protein YydD, contains DUF2326 domain [Paracidovorax konjaci]